MKKTIAAAASLFFLLCLGAHAWAGGVSLSQDRLDFGNMKEGLVAKKVVILQNSGQETLKIANVTTS